MTLYEWRRKPNERRKCTTKIENTCPTGRVFAGQGQALEVCLCTQSPPPDGIEWTQRAGEQWEQNISANQRVEEVCLDDREQLACDVLPRFKNPGHYRPQYESLEGKNETNPASIPDGTPTNETIDRPHWLRNADRVKEELMACFLATPNKQVSCTPNTQASIPCQLPSRQKTSARHTHVSPESYDLDPHTHYTSSPIGIGNKTGRITVVN